MLELGPRPSLHLVCLYFQAFGFYFHGSLSFASGLYHSERSPLTIPTEVLLSLPDFPIGATTSNSAWTTVANSNYKDGYHGEVARALGDAQQDAMKICKYKLNGHQVEYLTQFGIPFVQDAAHTHSHPEFKAVENFFLFADIPNRLKGRVLFISLKDFKMRECLKLAKVQFNNNVPDFSKSSVSSFYLANPGLTVADSTRYKVHNCIPHPDDFSPTMIVMCDSLHYLEPEEVLNLYHLYPDLEDILVPSVIPVEVREKVDSLYPHIYTLSYVGEVNTSDNYAIPNIDRSKCDRFTFHFTQNRTNRYEQPISCSKWLQTRSLSDGIYTVGVECLSSVGPQHLFAISRSLRNFNSEAFYATPNVVRLPELNPALPKLRQPFVPLKFYRQLLFHADSLNNYMGVDTNAKARTHAAQDDLAIPMQTVNALIGLVRLYRTTYTPDRRAAEATLVPSLLDRLFQLIHDVLYRFLSFVAGRYGRALHSWIYSTRTLINRLARFGQQNAWVFRVSLIDLHVVPRACFYFTPAPPGSTPPASHHGSPPAPQIEEPPRRDFPGLVYAQPVDHPFDATGFFNSPQPGEPSLYSPPVSIPDSELAFGDADRLPVSSNVKGKSPESIKTDKGFHLDEYFHPQTKQLMIDVEPYQAPLPSAAVLSPVSPPSNLSTASPARSASPTIPPQRRGVRSALNWGKKGLTSRQLMRLGQEDDDVSVSAYTSPSSTSSATSTLSQKRSPHGMCTNKRCKQHSFTESKLWKECAGGHGVNVAELGSRLLDDGSRVDSSAYFLDYFPKELPWCHLCRDAFAPKVDRQPMSNRAPPVIAHNAHTKPRNPGTHAGHIRHPTTTHKRSVPMFVPKSDAAAPDVDSPNRPHLPANFPREPPNVRHVKDLYQLNLAAKYSSLPATSVPDFHCPGPMPYPEFDCLLRALEEVTHTQRTVLWGILTRNTNPSGLKQAYLGLGLSTYHAHILGLALQISIYIHYPLGNSSGPKLVGWNPNQSPSLSVGIVWTPTKGAGGHFSAMIGKLPELAHLPHKYGTLDVQHVFGSGLFEADEVSSFSWPSVFSTVPDFSWSTYTPNREAAKAFWNAYKAEEVGLAFKKGFLDLETSTPGQITRSLETASLHPIQVAVVEGLPGSGKSRPIIERIRANITHVFPGSFCFGFPRVFLRKETVAKFPAIRKNQKDAFRTWEHALATDARFAIFDEFGLFPPGYFDFFILHKTDLSHMILLGDRLQGAWSPESEHARASSTLLEHPSCLDQFCKFSTYYRYYSYRIPHRIAACFNITSHSNEMGDVRFSYYMPHQAERKIPVLCPSDTVKGAYVRDGYAAFTYTEVQGAEWDEVVVKINNATLLSCSNQSIFTAVTRAKKILWIQSDLLPADLPRISQHPILGPLLGQTLPVSVLSVFPSKFYPSPILVLSPNVSHLYGSGLVERTSQALCTWSNQRLDYLPACFRANAPVIMEFYESESDDRDGKPAEDHLSTHLPSCCNPLDFAELEPVLPREDRELVYHDTLSRQFYEMTREGSLPYEANFFPKQTASQDPTLFASAIKTRFNYATPDENRREFDQKSWLGPILFSHWRKYLQLPEEDIEFDETAMLWATIQTVAVKLNKPISTIWNNIDRSEPEWPRNYMEAFVKSQSKAKAETGARNFRLEEDDDASINKPLAKPGQPLVTSPDVNVFDFGPWTRYMRAILYRLMRANVYIHGGRTLHDLDSFSKKYSTPGIASTCDFTKYDMSCRAETLSFELCIFSYFSLDITFPDLTELYFFIKTEMFTQLGTSAIMRFTGEFGTYDFNTWYNIAYMSFRYDLQSRSTNSLGAAFSGDDSILFYRIIERPDWMFWSKYFALEGKLFITDAKDFCGWWLLPCGAVRNPILLSLKILYHQSRGSLDRCLDSYFLEALYAYNLGDSLYDHCPSLALEAQSWVINFCFKHSNLVPHLVLISGTRSYDLSDLSALPARLLKQLMPRTEWFSFSLI